MASPPNANRWLCLCFRRTNGVSFLQPSHVFATKKNNVQVKLWEEAADSYFSKATGDQQNAQNADTTTSRWVGLDWGRLAWLPISVDLRQRDFQVCGSFLAVTCLAVTYARGRTDWKTRRFHRYSGFFSGSGGFGHTADVPPLHWDRSCEFFPSQPWNPQHPALGTPVGRTRY